MNVSLSSNRESFSMDHNCGVDRLHISDCLCEYFKESLTSRINIYTLRSVSSIHFIKVLVVSWPDPLPRVKLHKFFKRPQLCPEF